MRIRSIKPEFWRSPDVSCLAIEDRLLFIGLWSYVDDNGVGEDRVSIVAADLFADDLERDPSDTFARVSRGLANLAAAGRIIRYTVAGREYLEVANWSKHQRIDRPGKARMPTSEHNSAHIREGVAKARETPLTGTEEQRTRGTEDQGTCSSAAADSPPASAGSAARKHADYSPEFEAFWAAYPRKVSKRQAWRAWGKAIERATPEQITAGASRYANDPNRSEQYTKHGATWLNADGWDDEPLPSRQQQQPQRTWVDVARGMSQQNNWVESTIIEQGELE